MLERLGFSIPLAITINASPDLAWEMLTDIPSYPSTLASVLKAKHLEGRHSNHNRSSSSGGSSRQSNNSTQSHQTNNSSQHRLRASGNSSTMAQQAVTFMGSKWKITRISVLENQEYSAKVTITQCSEEDEKRSFTMSSDQMLGATVSLKLAVEPVAAVSNDDRWSGNNSSSDSSPNGDKAKTSASPCCRITAIVTMIPYQYFVKLLGVMCCLCLLKYRARMAMECDLEDLADVCERRAAERRLLQENDTHQHRLSEECSGERKCEEQRNQEYEADAAGGSCTASAESSQNSNRDRSGLRTIMEENCSGC
ncbi:hypothetical protein ACHAXR_008357 [Thalassiosira sp. AJA248-18]